MEREDEKEDKEEQGKLQIAIPILNLFSCVMHQIILKGKSRSRMPRDILSFGDTLLHLRFAGINTEGNYTISHC